MLKRESRLRKETATFFAASGALFMSVLWCAFSGPAERVWGPVLVRAGSPRRLSPPREPPHPPPLASGRNPFLPKGGPKDDDATVEDDAQKPIEGDTGEDEKAKKEPREGGRAEERPMWAAKGSCRVKGGETFGLLLSENGEYFIVREKQVVPGLGLKIVRIADSVLVVEDSQGQRLRHDILRPPRVKE